MVNQSAFQGLLIRHLESRQLANPKYSVRAFARDLHLSASAVNEIIKGERRVSVKFVEKLATKLEISVVEMSKIVDHGRDKITKKNLDSIKKIVQVKRKNQSSRKIEENQIEYISNWIHFAILSLIETKNFRSSPGRMAQRLGVELEQVQYALIRLQQLSLITVAKDGSISRCVSSIQTSEDVLSKALQLCHQNDMILAQQKMQQLKVDERDFTSFTFCGNPEKIKLGKQIIREAQEQLEQIMRDEEAQDVFRVCMYLFPLTKIETSHAS